MNSTHEFMRLRLGKLFQVNSPQSPFFDWIHAIIRLFVPFQLILTDIPNGNFPPMKPSQRAQTFNVFLVKWSFAVIVKMVEHQRGFGLISIRCEIAVDSYQEQHRLLHSSVVQEPCKIVKVNFVARQTILVTRLSSRGQWGSIARILTKKWKSSQQSYAWEVLIADWTLWFCQAFCESPFWTR